MHFTSFHGTARRIETCKHGADSARPISSGRAFQNIRVSSGPGLWSQNGLGSSLPEPHVHGFKALNRSYILKQTTAACQASTLQTRWAVRFIVMFLWFHTQSFSTWICTGWEEIVSQSITFNTNKFLLRLWVSRGKDLVKVDIHDIFSCMHTPYQARSLGLACMPSCFGSNLCHCLPCFLFLYFLSLLSCVQLN